MCQPRVRYTTAGSASRQSRHQLSRFAHFLARSMTSRPLAASCSSRTASATRALMRCSTNRHPQGLLTDSHEIRPPVVFYLLVRHALLKSGIDDHTFADYRAALLLDFGREDRAFRIAADDPSGAITSPTSWRSPITRRPRTVPHPGPPRRVRPLAQRHLPRPRDGPGGATERSRPPLIRGHGRHRLSSTLVTLQTVFLQWDKSKSLTQGDVHSKIDAAAPLNPPSVLSGGRTVAPEASPRFSL